MHLSFKVAFLLGFIVFLNSKITQAQYAYQQNNKQQQINEAYAKGVVEQKLGEYEASVTQFSKAIQLNPTHKEALFERGKSYMLIQAFSSASEDFNEVIRLDSNFADAFFYLASVYYQKKEYNIALSIYNKAIQIKADYVLAYNYRAETLRNLGFLEQALQDYDKAIEIAPKEPKLYFAKGKCLLEKEDYTQASNCFTQCIALNPKDPIYYHYRIHANFLAKNYLLTIADIKTLMADQPNAIETYHYALLATCQAQTGNYREAVTAISQVIDREPDKEYILERITYNQTLADTNAVLKDYLHLKSKDKEPFQYYKPIKEIYFAQKDYQNALEYINPMIENDPENAELYYQRYICKKNLGAADAAHLDLK
ncbi:MAG: tetratricopeptide repeat protein [Cytophagales bacterium]|nr:MAG: tetratricopeptide repeat protein [Cytophagales bacterium]